jgi:hypothetical protein
MIHASFLFDRLILAGGPPRSGTTLLARLLNAHPQIVTAVDTVGAHESWALYFYLWEVGLVQELRERALTSPAAQRYVLDRLVRDNALWGVAPSPKVTHYPKVGPSVRPDPPPDLPWYKHPPTESQPMPHPVRHMMRRVRAFLQPAAPPKKTPAEPKPPSRYCVPLDHMHDERWRLCLKSPEISFVLPMLADVFPAAQFVLVHRPVAEIAESMYRKAFEWGWRSYHKRWQHAVDANGRAIPPQGVPDLWQPLWQTATAFQRCVIYATSYTRAIALDVPQLGPERAFVYDHARLRTDPDDVLRPLAAFLAVNPDGFTVAQAMIRDQVPRLSGDLQAEYDAIQDAIDIARWETAIRALDGGQ